MLSLAAFRYRNALVTSGGPVERLELSDTLVLGQRMVLANVYLQKDLAQDKAEGSLYSLAHGSGTHPSPMVARYMAISEAMERWAHWQLHRRADGEKYGFGVDPSSNGMSAFPGFIRRQARAGALLEAAERFNLLHWWEGRLAVREAETEWPGVRAVVLNSRAPGVTVVLYQRTPEGFFAYGHAAAVDFPTACRKAAVEMERHAQVVTRHARDHGGQLTPLAADAHPIERRSLFFAGEEGHALFQRRLRSAAGQSTPDPQVVFDGPIPGPWGVYADVWRVVYAPPSRRFLGMEPDYFLW